MQRDEFQTEVLIDLGTASVETQGPEPENLEGDGSPPAAFLAE